MTSTQLLKKLVEIDPDKGTYVQSQIDDESFNTLTIALEGYYQATGTTGLALFLDGILCALAIKQYESAKQLEEMTK